MKRTAEGEQNPTAVFDYQVKKAAFDKRFLPVSREDMESRGWEEYDVLLITADAYVDHPSFGTAIISRVLESEGYRVAICAQPKFDSPQEILSYGAPRYAVMINGGNMDPMVANYTVAKRKRSYDYYSPGGQAGLRPDHATIVYSKLARKAFPGIPILIGGIEASLRRFAHYDYWKDGVVPSILVESGADILMYGMGELTVRELMMRIARGDSLERIRDIRGTCYLAKERPQEDFFAFAECAPYPKLCEDKVEYAKATRLQYREQDHTSATAILQRHRYQGKDLYLVQNPPQRPLTTPELDAVYDLPFVRYYHPCYEAFGGIPAIEEVEFSIAHNRGCIGGCSFCALAFHQGRFIRCRSIDSVVREAELITKSPRFKGYINDVGGPTANFRKPSCAKQKEHGLCRNRVCLAPEPCPALEADHSEYIELLKRVRALPGVKKVFVRSGIRFDYILADKEHGMEFLRELVLHHVSGQLKVAPEHCSDHVLASMNKPPFAVFEKFVKQYETINARYGLKQFLVPYLMSSHPGSRTEDAIKLAEYLNKTGRHPEQVQDFYPTPGTISTCMYFTGIDPRTMKEVYVPRTTEEKARQRALLQWDRPENYDLCRKALLEAGRKDLIGNGKNCLIRDHKGRSGGQSFERKAKKNSRPSKK